MTDYLKSILADAMRVIKEAEVPPHLEAVAFGKAIEILSRGEGNTRTTAARAIADPSGTAIRDRAAGSPIEIIADKLGLDRFVVEGVFSADAENNLELILGAGRLEEPKKPATQQLAVLVAGGRQLAGLEDWTKTKTIRDVCQQYGKFDTSNFADHIKELDKIFGFRGKGKSREVKINMLGRDDLKSMILSFSGSKP